MNDIGSQLRDVLCNYGEYWQIQQHLRSPHLVSHALQFLPKRKLWPAGRAV